MTRKSPDDMTAEYKTYKLYGDEVELFDAFRELNPPLFDEWEKRLAVLNDKQAPRAAAAMIAVLLKDGVLSGEFDATSPRRVIGRAWQGESGVMFLDAKATAYLAHRNAKPVYHAPDEMESVK